MMAASGARDKDLIISGGQNIFSLEVEEVILGLDGVAECAVIGLADELWGERVTAVVVLSRNPEVAEVLEVQEIPEIPEISQQQVISRCKSNLASFKAPKQVIIQSEPLPRTPTGKVTRFVLVERYQQS